MNILLIGAAGRLGAERVREFERRGHRLTESAPAGALEHARTSAPDVIVLDTGGVSDWRRDAPDLAAEPVTRDVPILVLHVGRERPAAQLIALVERVGGGVRSGALS